MLRRAAISDMKPSFAQDMGRTHCNPPLCRNLEIDRSSPSFFSLMAPSVERFACSGRRIPFSSYSRAILLERITTMTALTRLEMRDFSVSQSVNPVLDSTASDKIQQLLIEDCIDMSSLSVKPDRLTALQHLHIGCQHWHTEDSLRDFQFLLTDANSQQNSELAAHKQVQDAVLELPNLTYLSGEEEAEFFQLANAQGLKGWNKLKEFQPSSWPSGDKIEVWRKIL